MKLQVTDKAKGELFIRSIGKTVKSGHTVLLNDDQFYDSTTQAAIQAGLLITTDKSKSIEVKGNEYINIHKNNLSFRCINRSIPSGSTFFVREESVNDPEIISALNLNYIQLVNPLHIEEKKTTKKKVTKKKAIKKKATKKKATKKKATKKKATKKKATKKKATKKKATKKKATNKKAIKRIKRIGSNEDKNSEIDVSVGRPPKESSMDGENELDTHSLPQKTQAKAPEGMYAHDPRGEGVTIRKGSVPSDIFSDESNDINFVESTSDGDEISFVDNEQTRERAKKNGITNDVFDDNIEVE